MSLIIVHFRVLNTPFVNLSVRVASTGTPSFGIHPTLYDRDLIGRKEKQAKVGVDRTSRGKETKSAKSSLGPISLTGTIGAHRGTERN